MRILICRPDHYSIEYQINPWMKPKENPSQIDTAWVQWERLAHKINHLAEPIVLDGVQGLPDMVFTANAALILKSGTAVLSKFKHKERTGEEELFKKFFHDLGLVVEQPESYFEGAGDALYLKSTLIGGYGFRSDKVFYEEFADKLGEVVTAKLVDPYFYHLDTCFCPLNDEGDYLIYPPAFDSESLKNIREVGRIGIEVPESDARQFSCNAIVIGQDIILPSGCEETESQLQNMGYTTHPMMMTEFIKAGGACKCLTLKLDQDMDKQPLIDLSDLGIDTEPE